MKLQRRLLLFSTTQLVVFGACFALAYVAFERTAIPMFEELLESKCTQIVRMASGELDVSLGADDRNLMKQTVAGITRDEDFAALIVRDAKDRRVLESGDLPSFPLFAESPNVARDGDGVVSAWAPIVFEGVKLGSVAVAFDTDRVDALDAWAKRIALVVLLGWLVALGYSLVFARSFVSPIFGMMDFSRKVAGGALDERLAIPAPGELAQLRDNLNQMTAELADRARKAEEMHRELVDASRMAGMAEIATGVLHNVGNVLNSLNVSVSLVGDHVKASRVGSLTKSVELFEKYPGGLPAFLATEKGKVLPGYLTSVSKKLVEENTQVLGELKSITRNVDHIKAIVQMQQTYARPSGVLEPVRVHELVDDALRMGESSFAKHGIEVVKDYGDGATIVTDRHRVLQILINLISNARHALKDHSTAVQRLVVQVRRTATGVTLAVIDTGVGIPAENLDRIFVHGFTTKQEGHGFGLHASANAARELGGTLTAASAGPGKGATFTLELPNGARDAIN